jgi:hypothetical protein
MSRYAGSAFAVIAALRGRPRLSYVKSVKSGGEPSAPRPAWVARRAVALVGGIEQREPAHFLRRERSLAGEEGVVLAVERTERKVFPLVALERLARAQERGVGVGEHVAAEHLAELVRIRRVSQAVGDLRRHRRLRLRRRRQRRT